MNLRQKAIWPAWTIPRQALGLLFSSRALLMLSVVPILLGAGIYAATFYFLFEYFFGHITQWIPQPTNWYTTLFYDAVALISGVFLCVVGGLMYTSFGRLILAPFSEMLCIRTQKILGMDINEPTFLETLQDLPRLLQTEMVKLGFSLGLVVLALALTAIFPPFSIVMTALNFWVMGFQFVDYPMEVRKLGFRVRLRWAVHNFMTLMLFGMTESFFAAIPFVGILSLPQGVIGGTILYYQVEKTKGGLTV